MGETASLDRLVVAHLPAALRFAIRLTGDPDAAEEIVQESLSRAARNWQGFRGEATFYTWFLRIVINVFRDAARKPATESLEFEPPDTRSSSPLAQILASELAELVARHISNLPPRQREVLVLFVYEGQTVSQIATMLDLREGNVYTTLHLARTRLKRLLAPYLAEV